MFTTILLAACNRPVPVQNVYLYANVDAIAKAELATVLADYNAQTQKYSAALVEKDDPLIDLTLGPYQPGSIIWRSIGWRIWSRLETLAGIEGRMNRSLIRPLRERALDPESFNQLLVDIRAQGINPIIVPRSPGTFLVALQHYASHLGDSTVFNSWQQSGIIVEVPDLRSAIDQIVRGQAAFILGNDQFSTWLGQSNDNHPEGFPLPGSSASGTTWAIGRGDGFVISPVEKVKTGVYDLLVYLTSKGIAQRFGKVLPGTYYSWSELPGSNSLPVVNGPMEFLNVDSLGL
jgi:hypothetical protein